MKYATENGSKKIDRCGNAARYRSSDQILTVNQIIRDVISPVGPTSVPSPAPATYMLRHSHLAIKNTELIDGRDIENLRGFTTRCSIARSRALADRSPQW